MRTLNNQTDIKSVYSNNYNGKKKNCFGNIAFRNMPLSIFEMRKRLPLLSQSTFWELIILYHVLCIVKKKFESIVPCNVSLFLERFLKVIFFSSKTPQRSSESLTKQNQTKEKKRKRSWKFTSVQQLKPFGEDSQKTFYSSENK